MAKEIEAMIARHAVDGRLQSGTTAKKAVEIFEEESRKALDQSLSEIAKLIEHRGCRWRAACDAVGEALDVHIARSPELMARPFGLARATGDNDAARAIAQHLANASEQLRVHLRDFRDGWTAPKGKTWKERHPNWDRVIFMLIGGLITVVLKWIEN